MIEKNLKNGAYVVVKREDEMYQVFSPHKDGSGNYRRSGVWISIEEAKQNIGYLDGYKENLDELAKNWEVVEIFYGQQPTFKEGDRVKVLKTGEVGEIVNKSNVAGDYMVSNNCKNLGWHKPTYLAHAESEEVEELTVDQICKELGREIKIKR
jgi:hypothetical protein